MASAASIYGQLTAGEQQELRNELDLIARLLHQESLAFQTMYGQLHDNEQLIDTACRISETLAISGRHVLFFELLYAPADNPQPLRRHLRWLAAAMLGQALLTQEDLVDDDSLRLLVPTGQQVQTDRDEEWLWQQAFWEMEEADRQAVLAPAKMLLMALAQQTDAMQAVMGDLLQRVDDDPSSVGLDCGRLMHVNCMLLLALHPQRHVVNLVGQGDSAAQLVESFENLADLTLLLLHIARSGPSKEAQFKSLLPDRSVFLQQTH